MRAWHQSIEWQLETEIWLNYDLKERTLLKKFIALLEYYWKIVKFQRLVILLIFIRIWRNRKEIKAETTWVLINFLGLRNLTILAIRFDSASSSFANYRWWFYARFVHDPKTWLLIQVRRILIAAWFLYSHVSNLLGTFPIRAEFITVFYNLWPTTP